MTRARRRILRVGALASLLWVLPAHGQSQPEPSIEEWVTTYEIRGTTAGELTRQMVTLGPLDGNGRRFAANTRWTVRWTYPYARSTRGCATGPVRTDVTVKMVLPHWVSVRPALEPEWLRFSRALRQHEDGHREIAVEAAREIAAALARLEPSPTCEEHEKIADTRGEWLLQEARNRDKVYDRNTNHGETQGARMR